MTINFSRAAENDLLEIFLYSIEHHGLEQAERYKNQLEKAFQIISENPTIAQLRDEITPPVRIYPAQKHIIIYSILEDSHTVNILRIRHQRENW